MKIKETYYLWRLRFVFWVVIKITPRATMEGKILLTNVRKSSKEIQSRYKYINKNIRQRNKV